MKKIYQIVMMCVSLLFIVSCTNYQQEIEKACEECDFTKAYEILAEMKDKDAEGLGSLEEFVQGKEMMFLISQNTDDATERLVYLLNEVHRSIDYDPIMNLAIKNNNHQIVEALMEGYIGEPSSEGYDNVFSKDQESKIDNIINFCTKGKHADTIIKLSTIVKKGHGYSNGSYDIKHHSSKGSTAMINAFIEIDDKESNKYLKSNINQWSFTWDSDDEVSEIFSKFLTHCILNQNKDIADFLLSKADRKWKKYSIMQQEYNQAIADGSLTE